MKTLYSVEGIINRDFVGQIAYTISLGETYHKLDIGFAFDQQRFTAEEITPELEKQVADEVSEKYGKTLEGAELRQAILSDMKTEIHTLAMLDDTFIGCIHRQLTERHMIYDGDYATEGCIPTASFEGVLKVVVLVFNVIKDGTHYRLWIQAE
ncbi:MAG: hypothetical protein IKE03_00675 [Blautia sp.]|nr:hypothetical protein [Blautia sp.]